MVCSTLGGRDGADTLTPAQALRRNPGPNRGTPVLTNSHPTGGVQWARWPNTMRVRLLLTPIPRVLALPSSSIEYADPSLGTSR